jgi:hypothetical protein
VTLHAQSETPLPSTSANDHVYPRHWGDRASCQGRWQAFLRRSKLCPPRAERLTADAAEAAGSHDIEVCPVVIHQQAVFGHSLTASQTVREFDPTSLAAEEIQKLLFWARSLLAI